MPRFLSKLKLWFFGFVVVLLVLSCLVLNLILVFTKDTVVHAANRFLSLTHEISVGSLYFFSPNLIVLEDVVLSPLRSPPGESILLPRVVARVAWIPSSVKGRLMISHVTVSHPVSGYRQGVEFLKNNLARIRAILRELPKTDIHVRVRDARIERPATSRMRGHASVDFDAVVKRDVLTIDGILEQTQIRLFGSDGRRQITAEERHSLQFSFLGEFVGENLAIDHLVLKTKNFYAQLWGQLKHISLQLYGFMLMETEPPPPEPVGIWDVVKEQAGSFMKTVPIMGENLSPNVFVLDINGRLQFAFPKIEIERLAYEINNIPAEMKGRIFLREPVEWHLQSSFAPAKAGFPATANIERIEMDLTGTWEGKALAGNSQTDFYFRDNQSSRHSPDRITAVLQNWALSVDGQGLFQISLGKGGVSFWTNGNEHKVSLKDMRVNVTPLPGKIKYIHIASPCYDGTLEGRIWVDASKTPPGITALGQLDAVDAHQLDELLIHFAKVHGRLFSTLHLKTAPSLEIKGQMRLQEGQVNDFEFFQWLADTFHLPSLHKVDFHRATTDFLVDLKSAELNDIRLKSDNLNLDGYYRVDQYGLVSGLLSLDFYRNLLKESPRFRAILKMFEEEKDPLPFDFQLSGNQHAMNFQWLSNEVKTRIQERIPDFIERIIERNIDVMMEKEPAQ